MPSGHDEPRYCASRWPRYMAGRRPLHSTEQLANLRQLMNHVSGLTGHVGFVMHGYCMALEAFCRIGRPPTAASIEAFARAAWLSISHWIEPHDYIAVGGREQATTLVVGGPDV